MAGPRRTKPRLDSSMPEIVRIGRAFAERRIELRLTNKPLPTWPVSPGPAFSRWNGGSGSVKFGSVVEIADILGMHIDVGNAAE